MVIPGDLNSRVKDSFVESQSVPNQPARAVTNPDGSDLGKGVTGISVVPAVTFSLDTSAYASGDLLADTQVVTDALRVNNGTGVLQSLTLNDKDDQGVAMTVVILSANSSLGTENAAPSVTDGNADNILGTIEISSADWKDLGGCRVASIKNIGLVLKAATDSKNIYIALVNGSGTPTFTASGITARLGILQD